MSDRHTKPTMMPWIGPIYDGLAFVPSMGFVGSVMPGGRHRAGNPFERRPMMVQTCPCQPWRLAR